MRVNTLYGTKEVVTEQGHEMELRYYLVQDIQSDLRQDRGSKVRLQDGIRYGVRIVKQENGEEEQECLPGISASMEYVERLLRQMIYGLVTPITAVAVVDDWISMNE